MRVENIETSLVTWLNGDTLYKPILMEQKYLYTEEHGGKLSEIELGKKDGDGDVFQWSHKGI